MFTRDNLELIPLCGRVLLPSSAAVDPVLVADLASQRPDLEFVRVFEDGTYTFLGSRLKMIMSFGDGTLVSGGRSRPALSVSRAMRELEQGALSPDVQLLPVAMKGGQPFTPCPVWEFSGFATKPVLGALLSDTAGVLNALEPARLAGFSASMPAAGRPLSFGTQRYTGLLPELCRNLLGCLKPGMVLALDAGEAMTELAGALDYEPEGLVSPVFSAAGLSDPSAEGPLLRGWRRCSVLHGDSPSAPSAERLSIVDPRALLDELQAGSLAFLTVPAAMDVQGNMLFSSAVREASSGAFTLDCMEQARSSATLIALLPLPEHTSRRIFAQLPPFPGIVLPPPDLVVSQYGVARISACTSQDRISGMLSIAGPGAVALRNDVRALGLPLGTAPYISGRQEPTVRPGGLVTHVVDRRHREELRRFMGTLTVEDLGQRRLSRASVGEWMESVLGADGVEHLAFGLFDTATDGSAALLGIAEWRHSSPRAVEAAFLVRPDRRGRGLGLKLVKEVLLRAGELGLVMVEARTMPENRAMCSALERCGFVAEETGPAFVRFTRRI